MRAIADSIRELDPAATGITPAGNELLLQRLAEVGHTRELDLEAVTDERRPVFPGGVVILTEIVDALGIQQLRFVEGALRDGLLYDMVGRMTRSDARERTVSSMQRRYHVDLEQAERVEATALQFLSQVTRALGAGRSAGRAEPEMGGATARDRARRRPQRLSPPRRLPARERRHAGILRARSSSCWRGWWAAIVASSRCEKLEDLIPPWDQLRDAA